MGMEHEHLIEVTAEQIAASEGVSIDAIRQRWRTKFPDRPFNRFAKISREEANEISRNHREEKPTTTAKISRNENGSTAKNNRENENEISRNESENHRENFAKTTNEISRNHREEKPATTAKISRNENGSTARTWQSSALLYLLMIAPTAASVSNMYHVTHDITGEPITAILYTVVLSVTAIGFTLAGIRRTATIALAILLIAYESFCNLSRIYYGLMGGIHGNPTRFLGTVTDIFNTGTHYTSITLAAISAIMLAAVQYAAIFELQKGKSV